jgi:hypothetical protein
MVQYYNIGWKKCGSYISIMKNVIDSADVVHLLMLMIDYDQFFITNDNGLIECDQ